jgi:hypothetical protein
MDWVTKGLEFEYQQGKNFSLLHVGHSGSGTHPAPMDMGGGGLKQPGH